MATEPHRSGVRKHAHIEGWLVSVLLHGTVALVAILLMKQIQPTSQDEAFKWNVIMASTVQPAASPRNEDPAPIAQSKTSRPSHHIQQTPSSHTLPSPQPIAQQTRPSISEQGITPMVTEV